MKQAIMTTQGNIEFRYVDTPGKLVPKEILLKILPVFILVFPGVSAFCFEFEPISGYMYITKGWHIPFMMQAWWLFVMCTVIYFTVSYLTQRPPKEVTDYYTWDHPFAVVKGKITTLSDVRGFTIILILTLVTLYVPFS